MIKEIFNPKTVAVVGATERADSVGRGLVENLRAGSADLFYVNPSTDRIFEAPSYDKVTDIDVDLDLVVIAIPKTHVPAVIDDCIEAEVGAVIIISAGFGETGKEGKERQDEIAKKLEEADIPLVGPNCLGVIRPSTKLNASFAPGHPDDGSICLISQSGALIDSIIDSSQNENYGFSSIISVGNGAGLSLVDYIKMADEDPKTKVISLYIEGVEDGREFFNCLKETDTPVVAIKGGKTEKAKEAICSHTGSLAGKHRVFSAALKQAGAFEASSLEVLFDLSKALAWQPGCGERVAVVTNGGGAGVLLTDYIYENDLELAELKEETIKNIESDMHPDYSKSNPLDVVGDALPERYEVASREFIKQENVDALVVVLTLQIMTDPLETARRIARLSKECQKSILTVFMGSGKEMKKATDYLETKGIPNYSDPQRVALPIKALNYKDKN